MMLLTVISLDIKIHSRWCWNSCVNGIYCPQHEPIYIPVFLLHVIHKHNIKCNRLRTTSQKWFHVVHSCYGLLSGVPQESETPDTSLQVCILTLVSPNIEHYLPQASHLFWDPWSLHCVPHALRVPSCKSAKSCYCCSEAISSLQLKFIIIGMGLWGLMKANNIE